MTSTMFSSPGAVWAVNNIVLAEQWLRKGNGAFNLFRGVDCSICDKQAKMSSESKVGTGGEKKCNAEKTC